MLSVGVTFSGLVMKNAAAAINNAATTTCNPTERKMHF